MDETDLIWMSFQMLLATSLIGFPPRNSHLTWAKSALCTSGYDIRLYCPHEEEWKVITIDDRLPYWQRPGQYGNLCFAKQSTENEFWPCLLEKAVAKLVGAYYRISS